nr:polysaccharide deacetylase family protein [uncultured Desulfobulbus sp.]
MKIFFVCIALLVGGLQGVSWAGVVTSLPGNEPIVALTFDACETKTPSFFDETIVSYLLAEQIPFTLFVSGKFARRNADELRQLARNPLIEVENHSLNHRQHMERLSDTAIVEEVLGCEALITGMTGRKPIFFRFPAGNYDQRSLKIVEGLGYRVVHWTFASGDPDKRITPGWLSTWVLNRTRQGNILIFHINGRGYSTAKALPVIVQQLRKKGYRFVLLRDVLGREEGKRSSVQDNQVSPPISLGT